MQYMAGLKAHDVEMIGASLAEDVQFVTPAETMDKPMILEFLAEALKAHGDFRQMAFGRRRMVSAKARL